MQQGNRIATFNTFTNYNVEASEYIFIYINQTITTRRKNKNKKCKSKKLQDRQEE